MIARRLSLAVQTALLCVLCAFGPPHVRARIGSDLGAARVATQSQGPRVPRLYNSSAHTLHLQNSNWKQIRVEVRVGPNATCDAFQPLGVQLLQQGQEWKVQFDDDVICWRSDQTPGDPASKWAAWHQVNLADAEIRVVTL